MPKPRLLASVLLAFGFVLTAEAQYLTPSGLPPLAASGAPISPFSASHNQPFSAATIESTPQRFNTLTAANNLSALRTEQASAAQSRSPCFTLRSYNFTERDLKSAHPHASSEIDCTPAAKGHFLTRTTKAIAPWLAQPSPASQPPSSSNHGSHN